MELIFDRTQNDITQDTAKAYIAYTDLNRIEEACAELAGYIGVSITTKVWKISDFRTTQDMTRLHNNIKLLQESYYANPKSPQLPAEIKFTSIKQANTIEECLYRVWEMYASVLSGIQRLSFTCGRKSIGNRGGA